MSWQSTPTWHLDETTLRAYVDGHPLSVVGASVESHLLECPDCRVHLGELMPHEIVDRAWSADPRPCRDTSAQPRGAADPPVGHLDRESARLLVAVPAFRGAWLLGLFVVTLFAGLAALFAGKYGLTLFLIVAPLAPVAGVAASFGGDADPCHELVTVTPYPAVRMLMLRTAGVLATSLPITLLAGLALPGPAWLGVAWLTPAAAGVALTLLLTPLFGSTVTATTLGACWSVGVVFAARVSDPVEVVEPDHAADLPRPHAGRRRGPRPPSTRPSNTWEGSHEHRHPHRPGQVLRPHHRTLRSRPRARARHHRAARPQRRRQDHHAADPGDRARRRHGARCGSSGRTRPRPTAGSPYAAGSATCPRRPASPAGSRRSRSWTTWRSSRSGPISRPATRRCAG